jgi:hypothetical protein
VPSALPGAPPLLPPGGRSAAQPAPADPLAEVRTAIEDGFAGFQIDMPDGTSRSVAEVLDDLQGDTGFDAFIQACAITGGAQ